MNRLGKFRLKKLERIENRSVREMRQMMFRAKGDVAKLIRDAATRKGIVTNTKVKNEFFSAVGNVYDVLDRELTAYLKDTAYQTALISHENFVADVRSARGSVKKAVVLFDRKRFEETWNYIAPENGRHLAGVATARMKQAVLQNLRNALTDTWRLGELEGLTLKERAAMISQKWGSVADGIGSRFVDASGRAWKDDVYLQMLTRTTLARANRDVYADSIVKDGFDLAIIENVDGGACDICQEWDGVVVSITGKTDGLPTYQQALDDGWGHPNCRCSFEYADEDIDKYAIEETRADWSIDD